MAGYRDTKKLIEDTLVGRPAGTLILPEGHQNFALSLLDYIRSIELLGSSVLQGIAQQDTVPIQPNDSKVSYVGMVPAGQTYTFTNFYDENGDSISVESESDTVSVCLFIWNCVYWSVQVIPLEVPGSVEVVDNVQDGGRDKALSAEQGVILNTKVTAVANMLVAVGQSIDAILKKAAYKDADVADNITELENILSASITGISVVFSHSGVYYDKQGLDGLREYLTVTAHYLDGTENEVSAYSLSGTLVEGTQTITVSYLGKTATFTVVVEEVEYYRTTDFIAYKIALISTVGSNKSNCGVINGVTYYYTQKPSASEVINYRACYYLFDLLWTPGESYEIEVFYHGKPSGYGILIGLQAFNQSFYNDGVINSSATKNHGSDMTDSGWLTPTDDGTSFLFPSYTAPSGTKGTRIVFKTQDQGVDTDWPSDFILDYFVIRKTS